MQSLTHNNIKYIRYDPNDHWIEDDEPPDVPHVLCGKCLNHTFIITFGMYSVLAKCDKCGHEAEVYSG